MPAADFFARLKLFLVKNFLDDEVCLRLRTEMQPAAKTLTMIRTKGNTHIVDEEVRKAKRVKVSGLTRSFVETRLLALKPALEDHFNLALMGCEKLQFLAYNEGDFYRPHRDNTTELTAPEYAKQRKISVVIFLNGETDEAGQNSYRGGALTFYGLVDDPRWRTYGFPLKSEAGLLVAFRSEICHEVAAVTGGERYTIVSWFF
jgi:SM-20-related protein